MHLPAIAIDSVKIKQGETNHEKSTRFDAHDRHSGHRYFVERLRPDLMGRYADCLRLNLRVASLAASKRWIGETDVAASYDALAPGYEQNWLSRLQPTTLQLLEQLPRNIGGRILDLGCGTGFTTDWMANQYPLAHIRAQDISTGMLEKARRRVQSNRASFACGDMLDFMKNQPGGSAELVVSAWAIGYSNPRKIMGEVFRTLQPGGRFALVVNLMDTLRPVYVAFRKTMQRYPEKLRALAWPRFPASGRQLEKQAQACGFETQWRREGAFEVCEAGQASLSWLLSTGILAGFDAMLPLRQDAEAAAYFEQGLKTQNQPLAHHHTMAIFRKHE